MNKSLIFSLSALLLLLACETKKQRQYSPEEIADLNQLFVANVDSIQVAWDIMIEDDDLKILDLKNLVVELENTGTMETEAIQQANAAINQLAASRYNQQTMAQSELIDAYDHATFEAIENVLNLAKTQAVKEENDRIGKLSNDILLANERVLMYRIYYDRFAKIHNKILTEHPTILALDSVAEYARIPLALFEIVE